MTTDSIRGPRASRRSSLRIRSDVQWAIAIGCVYVILQVVRAPDVLLRGRYFAEEGAFWWGNALGSDWLEQATFVAPLAGYVTMNANLQILVSALLPTTIGPLWSSWSSLALMMLAAAVAWLGRPHWLRRRWAGVLALGLLVGPPVVTAETFANSINSQVYLGLAGVIIVVLGVRPQGRTVSALLLVAVGLGALSGFYTAVLAPLFLVRALLPGRTWREVGAALICGVGLIVQFAVFLSARSSGSLWPGKVDSIPPAGLAVRYVVDSGVLLLLGESSVPPTDMPEPGAVLIASALLLVLVLGLTWVLWMGTREFKVRRSLRKSAGAQLSANTGPAVVAMTLALAAVAIEFALVLLGQAEVYFAGRYFVVPAASLMILMIVTINNVDVFLGKARASTVLFVAFAGLSIVTSAKNVLNLEAELFRCNVPCVAWSDQVDQVGAGERTAYGHWPMRSDPGDWTTDPNNPQVQLAPFQEEAVAR